MKLINRKYTLNEVLDLKDKWCVIDLSWDGKNLQKDFIKIEIRSNIYKILRNHSALNNYHLHEMDESKLTMIYIEIEQMLKKYEVNP